MGRLCLLLSLAALTLSAAHGNPGVTNQDLANLRLMFASTPEGHRAANPWQRWTARFDSRGFAIVPSEAGWTWGLSLESWGRPGNENPAGERLASAPGGTGTRIQFQWGNGLEEWFVNEPRGLEHGFTLHRRPAGSGETAFLRLRVHGDLSPVLASGQTGATFLDAAGMAALRYGGLKVWDADGRVLPARIASSGGQLRIEWDDAGARYPVTVDPLTQQAYIKASNAEAFDEFGASVALDGDTAVVGAPKEDGGASGVNADQSNNAADGGGAAYVFVRVAGTWSQQAYLKASNAQASAAFGTSVSISGETIAVGAPGEATGGAGTGAVYVFVRSGSAWNQQAILKASNPDAGDEFGTSVAVFGDTIVAGAPKESSTATGVDGNQTNNGAILAGAAYVFLRTGSTWTHQAYLKASNTEHGDQFGTTVALYGATAVIGAPNERSNATGVNGNQSDNSALASGAVYVFVRNGTAWSQEAYLKASNTETFDSLGSSVAISGDTIVAGAPAEDSAATGINNGQSDNSSSNSGAAYVFVRNTGAWSQQAYLKASNTGSGDAFGRSVAIAGDRILVGADWEDSNEKGTGAGANNSAGQSGAAYLFLRSANAWNQEAYLKASNTFLNSFFGSASAVSGNAVLVGSRWENSDASGINGDQNNVSALASGAVYAFHVDPGSGGCTYTLNANSVTMSSSGGSGSVTVTSTPGCTWSALTPAPWITILSGSPGNGPGTVNFSVAANTSASRSGIIAIAGKNFTVNQDGAAGTTPVPGAGVPNPSSGSGTSATFTFTFNDANGAADLNILNVLINSAIDGRNACYIAYIRSQNTIVLVNNAGDAGGPFAGVGTIPGSGTIANSQCSIDLGFSSAGESGNTLTLVLRIGFDAAFAGSHVVYTAARDNALNNSGWIPRGVWTVPGAPSNGTSVVSMTPARSSAGTATLTTVFSDTAGFADLNILNLLINNAVDGRNACYLAYVRSANLLVLVDDAGNAGGPYAGSVNIPGSGVAANSQCAINAAASSAVAAGNTLTLTLQFTFQPSFRGDRIIYAAARDTAGSNSGWRAMGTITIP
jgi:hypothetical protein